MEYQYIPWTVGKIEGSMTDDLDRRVEDLINMRNKIEKSIQDEIDFIFYIVEGRIKNEKINNRPNQD